MERIEAVDVCFADLNGEVWRSSEWEFAYLRNGRRFRDPLNLQHPSDNWGDLGAASAAMLTVLACAELREELRGYRSALVCASADTRPSRSALLLALPARAAATPSAPMPSPSHARSTTGAAA